MNTIDYLTFATTALLFSHVVIGVGLIFVISKGKDEDKNPAITHDSHCKLIKIRHALNELIRLGGNLEFYGLKPDSINRINPLIKSALVNPSVLADNDFNKQLTLISDGIDQFLPTLQLIDRDADSEAIRIDFMGNFIAVLNNLEALLTKTSTLKLTEVSYEHGPTA